MDDFVVSQNVLRVIITNDLSKRQNYGRIRFVLSLKIRDHS